MINKLLAFSVALVLASGCSPARKIEKAEQLVITTPASFQKVGGMYFNLYRQPIDTAIITRYLPGKVVEIPTVDSFAMYVTIQSLQDSFNVACREAVDIAYRKGATDAWKELMGKSKVRVDTVFKFDPRCAATLKLVDDSLTRANLRIERMGSAILSEKLNTKNAIKERDKYLWLFIAACVVLSISVAGFIASKFKLF